MNTLKLTTLRIRPLFFLFSNIFLMLLYQTAADAQTPSAQKEGKLRLGHYSSGDGLTGFILDRTQAKPLLRFDGQTEILVLTPQDGVANGTHLVGDDGAGVAEIGKDASVTVYLQGHADGVASYRDADAEPLKISASSEQAAKTVADSLAKSLKSAGANAAAIEIDWSKVAKDARSWAVLTEAMANAERAISQIASDELGKEALSKGLKKVRLLQADTASAEVSDGVLTLRYAPAKEFEGRLSSKALAGILEKSL